MPQETSASIKSAGLTFTEVRTPPNEVPLSCGTLVTD